LSFLVEQQKIDPIKVIDTSECYVYTINAIPEPEDKPSTSYADIIAGKSIIDCPIEQQCVAYVKSKGVQLPQGNANQIESNTDVPCVGCVVLLYSSRWGHVAFIEEIASNSILISEKNHLGCGIISTRSLELTDNRIKGYFK